MTKLGLLHRKQILELFQSGKTQVDIAAQLKIATSTVRGVIRVAHPNIKNMSSFSAKMQAKQVKQLMQQGKTLKEIAEELGLSRNTVIKRQQDVANEQNEQDVHKLEQEYLQVTRYNLARIGAERRLAESEYFRNMKLTPEQTEHVIQDYLPAQYLLVEANDKLTQSIISSHKMFMEIKKLQNEADCCKPSLPKREHMLGCMSISGCVASCPIQSY